MQMQRVRASAAAALSLLSVVAVPQLVQAQDSYIGQVVAQLVALGGGGHPTDSFIGKVLRGQSETLSMRLEAGREYLIVGVCDEDCTDIDLTLYDENGRLIDLDHDYDDFPRVIVTPAWTGPFYLEVTVPSCHAWRCTVGIGLFEGRAV